MAGENLAGLYSLNAACEVNGVDAFHYRADVVAEHVLRARCTPERYTAPNA